MANFRRYPASACRNLKAGRLAAGPGGQGNDDMFCGMIKLFVESQTSADGDHAYGVSYRERPPDR
jgi:hypothetical protein